MCSGSTRSTRSSKRIARTQFTYLADCRGRIEVVLGDGRLSLEREQPQQYDVLAVDAFSGDAVPVHLLTKQALELYFRHLKPGGILALHITNTHLDLAPVVENLRRELGKYAVLVSTTKDEEDETYTHPLGPHFRAAHNRPGHSRGG